MTQFPQSWFFVLVLKEKKKKDPNWLSSDYVDGLSVFPKKIVDGLWILWQHPSLWNGYEGRSLGSGLDFIHTSKNEILVVRSSNTSGVTHADFASKGWKHETMMGVGQIETSFAGYVDNVSEMPRLIKMKANERGSLL